MTDKEILLPDTGMVRVPACDQCPLLIQVRAGHVRLVSGSDVWKWVATTLSGTVLGMLIFLFSFGTASSTQNAVILAGIDSLKAGQIELKARVAALEDRQSRVMSALESQGKTVR